MIPTFSFKKYDTFSAFSYLHFCTWQQWKTDHAVINCTAVMIIWVVTHFVHRSTYNKRVNISAFGSIRHRLQKQQIRRNWNHKDPNLVEEMYTTCPLICWCSSMFSLLWCKILLHYNEYSPFRRSNFYHTWNISYRTISTPSFLVKIATCLGLNSLVLTVKTHQPCFRLFARGVFLSVISSASLPFFCRHPAILDFCVSYRWQIVPRLPFPVPRSPLPVPRFSNIREEALVGIY